MHLDTNEKERRVGMGRGGGGGGIGATNFWTLDPDSSL